jgi:hypothetical protein
MSKNKGLADDGYSDSWIRSTTRWDLLRDIWNKNTMENTPEIFKARLVPLNKKWPDIPSKDDFRPIAIISHLYKFLELRFANKLQDYLSNRMDKR